MKYTNLQDAILENANLKNANSNLKCTDLENANLKNADLKNANLENAYLKNADLRNANLIGADLSCANLIGADLSYANLRRTDLENANLENADLKGAKFYLTNLYKVKRDDLFGVSHIGSRDDTTHYFVEDNRIICECFDNTLENFEEKVKDTYDKNSKEYVEYMIAIDTFKRYKKMYEEIK